MLISWLFWLFSSKLMSERCNKCKVSFRSGGDTWCTGCAAWETIGLELCNSWSGPAGLRRIAEDIALSAARQIRALRAVGAGSGRASTAPSSAGVRGVEVKEEKLGKGPGEVKGLAAKSKATPPGGSDEYTYTEEEAEEEESRPHTRAKSPEVVDKRPTLQRRQRGDSALRPPEGTVPPTVKEEPREERELPEKEKKRSREEEEYPQSERRKDKKSEKSHKEKKGKSEKRKRRRGGRKHQRLSRLAEDPFRPHHRKLSERALEGRQDLDLDI